MRSLLLLLFFTVELNAQVYQFSDTLKATGVFFEFTNAQKNKAIFVTFGPITMDWNFWDKSDAKFWVKGSGNADTSFVMYSKYSKDKKNGYKMFGTNQTVDNSRFYKTYISIAKDATNKLHYAFYINFDNENKWHCLAKYKAADTSYPKQIQFFQNKKTKKQLTLTGLQVQYQGKGFAALDSSLKAPAPTLRPLRDADSLSTATNELARLSKDLAGKAQLSSGLYYEILKEGNSGTVSATDTVTVHYKGWNYLTQQVFDQTEKEPATFPLKRLIPGWQIGIPLCKVGGKIRLYLPSGLAYGIRNMNNIIAPNSILVFDIEVLNTKKAL